LASQHSNHHTTTVLRSFFRDHPGQPVPEEKFWTLWCKGRLTEADTLTIQLGVTPSGLTTAHLHHPPYFYRWPMTFLQPNQQHQSSAFAFSAQEINSNNKANDTALSWLLALLFMEESRTAFTVLNRNRIMAMLHTSMNTKITRVLVQCLNGRDIRCCFHHLDNRHN